MGIKLEIQGQNGSVAVLDPPPGHDTRESLNSLFGRASKTPANDGAVSVNGKRVTSDFFDAPIVKDEDVVVETPHGHYG